MQGDTKVGTFGVINIGTAADCVNRGTDAVCKLCDVCYAWIQAFKPNVAKMQIDRSLFFRENTPEQISKYVQKAPYEIFRISQEGDFRNLDDFKKVMKIAELNPDRKFYGYTKVQEVLDYIENNANQIPKNLQINNSLGTWDKGNYVAAHWSEIIDYLDDTMWRVVSKNINSKESTLIDNLSKDESLYFPQTQYKIYSNFVDCIPEGFFYSRYDKSIKFEIYNS